MFALIFNAVTSSVVYGVEQNGVLICTSQGYKWLKVENETSETERAQQHCKLCLFPPSEEHFDDVIANTSVDSSFSFEQITGFSLEYQVISRFAYLVAQGRAPPLNTFSI